MDTVPSLRPRSRKKQFLILLRCIFHTLPAFSFYTSLVCYFRIFSLFSFCGTLLHAFFEYRFSHCVFR